jgi:acyl carrier protein
MAGVRDQISEVLYSAISVAMNKPIEELTDGTQLVADLGAKSANLVRIISIIEDELDLDVSFQEFSRKKSIGALIDYLVDLHDS